MATTEDAIQIESLQLQTEAEYDATVRADIELFRAHAEKFVAGEITDDQFRAQRLRRGIYGQRQPGVQMIRTKVPGGILTAAANGSTGAYRRRVRRRQRSSHHAAEHSISLRAFVARAGSAASARRCSIDDARSLLQHRPQRHRLPIERTAGRGSFRRTPLRAQGSIRISAQRTDRQSCRANSKSLSPAARKIACCARSTISGCAR